MENKIKNSIIADKKERLDVFLMDFFEDFSRSKVQKMVEEGLVKINGEVKKPSYKLKIGDCITIEEKEEATIKPQNIALDIKYEDNDLIVLNKPKNMLTHPTANNMEDTLVNALLYHCGENLSDIGGNTRRGIVHRLDKNTSGLMLAAKTNKAHENLALQIKEKTATRKYLAVVAGIVETDKGTISKPISRTIKETVKMKIALDKDKNAKEAVTHFKVLERFDEATFVELKLETGRTHQIRVHMASINHPVLGDTLYGAKGFRIKGLQKIKLKEQVLQSYYLRFTHPTTQAIMEFEIKENEFEDDLKHVLKILKRRTS
jgi:23S rRNA pseudouridine1911/1915/1917 synthase